MPGAEESAEVAAQAAGMGLFGLMVNIALALLVFLIAWVVASWVRGVVRTGCEKAKMDLMLGHFFASAARWTIIVVAGITALSMVGVPTTNFTVVLGTAGLAIGLALKDTLANFASGVMLLVFRPFTVGDAVEIAGETGTVETVDLFTTTMDTFDRRRVYIPNGKVYGSTIENISHHEVRRAEFSVGVSYDADIDRTREVLTDAMSNAEHVLADPEPQIILNELGDSAVAWTVRVYCEAANLGAARQSAIRSAKMALDSAGIDIPYPQLTIRSTSGE